MLQDPQIFRRQIGVSNVFGLNLRAADKFVTLAATFQSEISVLCKDVIANGKSIISLLSLFAECGSVLVLEAEGCDAETAVAALSDLIANSAHDSKDQHAEMAGWNLKARPTKPGTPSGGTSTYTGKPGSPREWALSRQATEAGLNGHVSSKGRWVRT